jgi:hypothetical protein
MVRHPDYHEATRRLTACVTLDRLAEVLGASTASVRRARLDVGSKAYRSPPPNWKAGVITCARERIRELEQLVRDLEDA